MQDESAEDLERTGPHTDANIMKNATVISLDSNVPLPPLGEKPAESSAPTVEESSHHGSGTMFVDDAADGHAQEDSNPADVARDGPTGSSDFCQSLSVDTAEASSAYVPKWLAANGFKIDDPWICWSLLDNLPPPGYVSILRNLDAKELLDRHNLLTAQKVGTDSEIRLRFEYELQQNHKLEKKLERREKQLGNLKARVEELEGGSSQSEELRKRLSELESSSAEKDKELAGLKSKNQELESLNKGFSEKVLGLEMVCGTFQGQIKGEEYLVKQFEEREEAVRGSFKEQIAGLDAKLDVLNEEFYTELLPRYLMALESRRWVIGHGFRRAFNKFKECPELKTCLGGCITATLAEGLRQGLEAWVVHGANGVALNQIEAYKPDAKEQYHDAVVRLSQVPFPLLESLEACRDSPLEFLMSQLVLEEERIPGLSEVTFGPPVVEERLLPEILLKTATSRPRAIAAYKEAKCKKYGRDFYLSEDQSRPSVQPAPALSMPGSNATSSSTSPNMTVSGPVPSAPVTGPRGEEENHEDDMFDPTVLGRIDPEDFS